jgi:prolyl-tRNA synthetase
MAHSDDKGLVLPPKLAPKQVVIVPIFKNNDELEAITVVARGIIGQLKELNITADYDDRDTQKPGWKFAEYELKGVPVRIAIGPRDLEDGTVELARRDTSEKQSASQQEVASKVKFILSEMQQGIYKKALKFRDEHITPVTTFDEFKEVLENKGGFIMAHWDGTAETELQIKEETKATIRCIPLNQRTSAGICVYSGKPSEQQVYFDKAY